MRAQEMRADAVSAALRESFGPPSFAFLEQVANGTGSQARRWADAIAVGIWPSRGLLIHGFEIKVSKSDWRNELKDPAKSAEVQKFCDRWWIAAPKGIVQKQELPPTWGLVEVNEKGKLLHTVTAPELQPEPLTRGFLAAMIRRHSEAMDGIVARERRDAEQKTAAEGSPEVARELRVVQSALELLQKDVAAFEEASGVAIRAGWQGDAIGKAVRVILDNQHTNLAQRLRYNAEHYRQTAKQLEKSAAEIERVG